MYQRKLSGLILLASILLAGCSTPLQKAVKSFGGDIYAAKQPASNEASLGKRFLNGAIDVNQCYTGELAMLAARSWDNISMIYEGDARGALQGDFGNTLRASAGGTNKVNSEVKLEDNEIQEIRSLAFDPQSPCLQEAQFGQRYSGGGAEDKVIVRAVMAKKISIVSKDSNGATVSADVRPVAAGGVGGTMDGSVGSSTATVYKGTSLFYAHEVRTYHTTVEQKIESIPVSGATSSLGSCSFTLIGVDPLMSQWGGQLNCVGDATPTVLRAPLGSYNGKNRNGVTHSLKVSQSRPGLYDIEMNKITVRDVR